MRRAVNAAAAQLLNARRARDELFGEDRLGFGEPAWDILLCLMANDDEAIADDHLLGMVDVPAPVIRRYIEWLSGRGLIEQPDPSAGHILTERARALMERYLGTVSDPALRSRQSCE